jgi:hypothetical protein
MIEGFIEYATIDSPVVQRFPLTPAGGPIVTSIAPAVAPDEGGLFVGTEFAAAIRKAFGTFLDGGTAGGDADESDLPGDRFIGANEERERLMAAFDALKPTSRDSTMASRIEMRVWERYRAALFDEPQAPKPAVAGLAKGGA